MNKSNFIWKQCIDSFLLFWQYCPRWVRGDWWWPEFPRLLGSISMHIWQARFCAPNNPLSSVSGNIFLQKMINCKEFPIRSPLPVKIHDNLIVHYSFGTFLDSKWLISFLYLDSRHIFFRSYEVYRAGRRIKLFLWKYSFK